MKGITMSKPLFILAFAVSTVSYGALALHFFNSGWAIAVVALFTISGVFHWKTGAVDDLCNS